MARHLFLPTSMSTSYLGSMLGLLDQGSSCATQELSGSRGSMFQTVVNMLVSNSLKNPIRGGKNENKYKNERKQGRKEKNGKKRKKEGRKKSPLTHIRILLNTPITTKKPHPRHTRNTLLQPSLLIPIRLIHQLMRLDITIEIIAHEIVVAVIGDGIA